MMWEPSSDQMPPRTVREAHGRENFLSGNVSYVKLGQLFFFDLPELHPPRAQYGLLTFTKPKEVSIKWLKYIDSKYCLKITFTISRYNVLPRIMKTTGNGEAIFTSVCSLSRWITITVTRFQYRLLLTKICQNSPELSTVAPQWIHTHLVQNSEDVLSTGNCEGVGLAWRELGHLT